VLLVTLVDLRHADSCWLVTLDIWLCSEFYCFWTDSWLTHVYFKRIETLSDSWHCDSKWLQTLAKWELLQLWFEPRPSSAQRKHTLYTSSVSPQKDALLMHFSSHKPTVHMVTVAQWYSACNNGASYLQGPGFSSRRKFPPSLIGPNVDICAVDFPWSALLLTYHVK
jgi:hypothetical protein